jgi:hypothetical protein
MENETTPLRVIDIMIFSLRLFFHLNFLSLYYKSCSFKIIAFNRKIFSFLIYCLRFKEKERERERERKKEKRETIYLYSLKK